jgi:hypothetical protein
VWVRDGGTPVCRHRQFVNRPRVWHRPNRSRRRPQMLLAGDAACVTATRGRELGCAGTCALAFCDGRRGRRSRGSPCVVVSERERTRGGEGLYESLRGFGLDTRTLRGHGPAVPASSLPGVTVSLQAGQSTYNRPGVDCLQRPLCSGRSQRLRPGVMCSKMMAVDLYETFVTHICCVAAVKLR